MNEDELLEPFIVQRWHYIDEVEQLSEEAFETREEALEALKSFIRYLEQEENK